MKLRSKEERILDLFFNEPTRHWHFEELLKASKVSRSKANKWLERMIRGDIVMRIKPRGKMPYYQGYFESPAYRNRKRMYSLSRLYQTGFLNHLVSLRRAKTVIIFGSFVRADWYKGSDVDLFIFGGDEGLDVPKYQRELGRDIQVFTAKSTSELKKYGPGLLRNILEGILIKGKLDFVSVRPHEAS